MLKKQFTIKRFVLTLFRKSPVFSDFLLKLPHSKDVGDLSPMCVLLAKLPRWAFLVLQIWTAVHGLLSLLPPPEDYLYF